MSEVSLRLVLAALVALMGATAVQAEQVGRAEFSLPSAAWVRLASHDGELRFDNGINTIPLHTAAFVLPGQGGVPRALLVVTSTEGSHRNRVRWTETCPASRPKYFTNDYGTNVQPNRRDCLVVNAAFGAPAFYTAQRWSWLLDALAAKGWKLPKGGYSVRGVVGNDRATLLNVQLSTQKDFVGLNGAVRDATDLRETPQTLVVWGEALHEAMRTSVYSVDGRLSLPPIVFESRKP